MPRPKKVKSTLNELLQEYAMTIETKDEKLRKKFFNMIVKDFGVNVVGEVVVDKPKKAVKATKKTTRKRVVKKVAEAEDFINAETTKKKPGRKAKANPTFFDDGVTALIDGEVVRDTLPEKHKKYDKKLAKTERNVKDRSPVVLIKATCSCGKTDDQVDPSMLADFDENGRPCKRAYRCNDCVRTVR